MKNPHVRAARNPVRMQVFRRFFPQSEEIVFVAQEHDGPRYIEAGSPGKLARKMAKFQEENSDELRRRKFSLEWAAKRLPDSSGIIIAHENRPVEDGERMEFLREFGSIRSF